MIEDLAIQYVKQTQNSLLLILYGIYIVGAVVAAIFQKSSVELRRAPYFAYSGLLYLIAHAEQLVWFGFSPAITGGFLWVLMFVDVVVGLGIGYALGVIAMARARDAYGDARMAILAFIPFANFWLLLTRPKSEVSANRAATIPLLTGGLGVLTGFVALIAGGALGVFSQLEMDRMAAEAENDPSMLRAGIDMILREQGLGETLRQMAAEVPSQRIDEITKLIGVFNEGTTLRYVYEVSTNPEALPRSIQSNVVVNNCTSEELRPLIEAGATIQHAYYRIDSSEVGAVKVTREICGY